MPDLSIIPFFTFSLSDANVPGILDGILGGKSGGLFKFYPASLLVLFFLTI